MDTIYDVIIIGGGAAATSAALTLRNRGKSALVVSNKVDTSSLWKLAPRISVAHSTKVRVLQGGPQKPRKTPAMIVAAFTHSCM